MSTYKEVYARSLEDPQAFWGKAAEAVHWHRKWDKVLDDSNPPFYRWFTGGELNTCYNALDAHVEAGLGERAALIYDSPITDSQRTWSYRELRDETARFAGVLSAHGVSKGDRVIIYMPMVAEAVIAMLAVARLGAGDNEGAEEALEEAQSQPAGGLDEELLGHVRRLGTLVDRLSNNGHRGG